MRFKNRKSLGTLISWLVLGQYVLLTCAVDQFHTCVREHTKSNYRTETHEKVCLDQKDHACAIEETPAFCPDPSNPAVKKGSCWACSYLTRNHTTVNGASSIAFAGDTIVVHLQFEIAIPNRDIPSCLRGRAPPTVCL